MRRLEYLIYDRTSWSRRFGFNIYPNAHPHNEHIHIEITRSAAADMTDLFYQISAAERDQYFAPTVAAYPPMTMPSAVVANGRRLQAGGGGAVEVASFELVRRKTICNYDKGRTYLGAFDQTCTEENGNCLLQEGHGGLQACANLCARTAGCVVFGWQNYKNEYPGSPDLANYDLRTCYQINVRSSAECGTSLRDMAVTDLDVYSLFSETDSLKLVFDLSIKVTGAVSCPSGRGWDGTVELPLTASSVELSIVPASPLADAPINPAAVPWLAKATADALRLGEGGELKISPVLARPFALVKSGARCSTGSVWLGDLPTAQQCAEMCASINQKPGVVSGSLARCEFFAWRPPGSPGTAVSGMSGSFSNRELDGCFMQQTATKACAEGWDRTAVGVTFNFYEMLDSVTTGSTKAARWWASYEQLRLNSEVVQAMAGDAEGLCALREQTGTLKLASG